MVVVVVVVVGGCLGRCLLRTCFGVCVFLSVCLGEKEKEEEVCVLCCCDYSFLSFSPEVCQIKKTCGSHISSFLFLFLLL